MKYETLVEVDAMHIMHGRMSTISPTPRETQAFVDRMNKSKDFKKQMTVAGFYHYSAGPNAERPV